MTLNGFQTMVADEDLGWSVEKAEILFSWAERNGMWADWSEWDSEQFIEWGTNVEQDFYRAFPDSPLTALYRAERERSRALHPTAVKSAPKGSQ